MSCIYAGPCCPFLKTTLSQGRLRIRILQAAQVVGSAPGEERCDGSATHRSTVYQRTRDIITWMFTFYLCIICQCPRGWWCICWVFICTSSSLRVVAFVFSKTVFCLKVATLALFMCHMVCRLHLELHVATYLRSSSGSKLVFKT